MTVAWQSPSARASPVRRRGQLPWIGWGLVSAWSLATVMVALFNALSATDGQVAGGHPHFGIPLRAGISMLFFVVWFTSFNFAFAGLVLGVISTARGATGRMWRSLALVALIVGGGIAETWGMTGGGNELGAPGYLRDMRLHTIAVCLVALVVVGGTAWLLGLRGTANAD